MKKFSVKHLVMSALFAALICVVTVIFPIKLPGGYANAGDSIVILSGCIAGAWGGCAASAAGAFIADILLGYAAYAPASFIIKGLMAFTAGNLFRKMRKRFPKTAGITAALAAEIIMIAGYFIFEFFYVGKAAAVSEIFGNVLQGAAGIVISNIFITAVSANDFVKNIFNL